MKKSKFEKLLKDGKKSIEELLDIVHELNVSVKSGTFVKDKLGEHYNELNRLSTTLSDLERDVINQANPENFVFGLNQVVELEDDE